MKKSSLFIIVCVLTILVMFSCAECDDGNGSETETDVETETETERVGEADVNESAETIDFSDEVMKAPEHDWEGSDEPELGKYETDFSQIYVKLEKDSYKIETAPNSKIKIIVGNDNGNLFDLSEVPYIQRFNTETNEWDTLLYEPPELDYGEWGLIVEETRMTFFPYYMKEPLTPGTYRFLVFVDKYTFVSPEFTLTEE